MIVQLKSESLSKSDFSGEITGVIFFSLGSFQFPEQGWDDFAVTIMGWWLRALIDLKTGASEEEKLLYMDGAFSVMVEKRSTSICCLHFIKGDTQVLKTMDLYPLSDLADSFLSTAQQLYSACLDHQWISDDIDLLKERIEQLSGLYPDLGECQT
ncbi:hypothetical protein [Endozoicomonas numazuensis]|uniref:Uncharacterized protein n=1 Tax=Endozoicomonas numazuensis TaxID=1137799 RepID=A0A081NJN5_9GAMM|nr:hypothetical protein [Endozoicomonas numazuensis]KEQ18658.1 hypothetical protein GZ78_00570 [Endozoicomonas numazuensis]